MNAEKEKQNNCPSTIDYFSIIIYFVFAIYRYLPIFTIRDLR